MDFILLVLNIGKSLIVADGEGEWTEQDGGCLSVIAEFQHVDAVIAWPGFGYALTR